MKTKIFLALACFMLAISNQSFLTTNACNVSGVVKDKTTGSIIGFATVQLKQHNTLVQGAATDVNGNFCFANVKDGTYDLSVSCVGYNNFTQKNFVVTNGTSPVLVVELAAKTKELEEVKIVTEKSAKQVQTMSYSITTVGGCAVAKNTGAARGSLGRGKANQVYAPSYGYYSYDAAPAPPKAYDLDNEPKPKHVADTVSSPEKFSTEEYDRIVENEFQRPNDKPLSTFSIDVDVASYGILRKKLNGGETPPKSSIRLEEMINYFTYDYAAPKDDKPFSVTTELGECPWNSNHQLLLVGVQGEKVEKENLPPANLVFLIDVSGSMQETDKLPLVQQSLRMLVNELRPQDRIAMVVYAGSAGEVLPSTPCSQKEKIVEAIDRLQAGGSTNGSGGITQAYETAKKNFLENGNNRVILCTDGDFNVGVSSEAGLIELIEKKREEGVFLSVLGFGMGNYKDSKMEKLADKGNGNYAYIDDINEAKKNLITQMGGTLLTIAKDVKIQVEFNPSKVKAYRLIGYENRALADIDFNDDKKDAGEIGAGVSVTALYEIVTDENDAVLKDSPQTDALKYQTTEGSTTASASNEMMTVKIRYKEPKEAKSNLLEFLVKDEKLALANTSENFRFASAVASFGMLLRDSKFKGALTYPKVIELAVNAKGKDSEGYRTEFISLVQKAKNLSGRERGEK